MKILIVDDEELTRTGVISCIDWEKLGINKILQADDGSNGLKIAYEEEPDIILSDVRMPRMDGITMLERIEKKLPNTVVVFMSGYSDKEYLKAAIQLKAIDYIEKPIEPKELQNTIKKAVERCSLLKLQTIADESHETKSYADLAYRFTMPYRSNSESIDELYKMLIDRNSYGNYKYITSIIVKINDIPEDPQIISDIYEAFRGYLKTQNMFAIYTEKKSYNIIFFVFSEKEHGRTTLMNVASELSKLLTPLKDYFIAVGDPAAGKENAYKSYSAAVILLQDSFFRKPGQIITKEDINSQTITLNRVRELSSLYMNSIDDNAPDKTGEIIDELWLANGTTGILENQLKAIYNDMLLHLFKTRRKKSLATDLSIENQETIMDIIEHCFYFEQMHAILKEKTDNFYADTAEEATDNPVIRIICEYIADHYAEPDLSVKTISDYAALSTSYVCTYFKNETGMTLNQYITDFRMKKAKQLLVDPRNKVNEISAAVGYSDGNYFAKSFRKYTGLSPSEYREQVIRS